MRTRLVDVKKNNNLSITSFGNCPYNDYSTITVTIIVVES